MASVESGSSGQWAQLIFTHDRKPPVLISKGLVRLGRKEGEKLPFEMITFTFAVIVQCGRFLTMYASSMSSTNQ